MVVVAPRPAGLVVDRDPEVAVDGMIASRRDHRERRHHPLRDAPVVVAAFRVPARADVQPAGAFDYLEHRPRIGQVVLVAPGALEQRIRIQIAAVQPRHVARIDAAFHRLQPVRFLEALAGERLRARHRDEFPFGERRLRVGRTHAGPQHAAALDERIGSQLDPPRET